MPNVTPSDHNYRSAVHEHEELTLPDFQRSLVWTNQQKTHLLFSTLLGFPIGAICVGKEVDQNTGQPVQYLLDGQQRLDCIIDMMDPANPCRWLEITKPENQFPTKPTQAEIKKYFEVKIWAAIYEFIDFRFESENTPEWVSLENDASYQRVLDKITEHNQKKEVAKANVQRKLKFEMEFKSLEAWVERLHTEPPELPVENTKIPAFIDIYIHHHHNDPVNTVLQKSKWKEFDPSTSSENEDKAFKSLFKKLSMVSTDADKITNVIFDAVNPDHHLKITSPSQDPVKLAVQREKAKKKFRKAIEDSMTDITPYLAARRLYISEIAEHKIGWLVFDAGKSRAFHPNELAKVFELVNMSGVKLSVIELLAARYGWRKKITLDKAIPEEQNLFEAYRLISSRMGLHKKNESELTRDIVNKWHLASGFGAVMRNDQASDELEWILSIPDTPREPSEIAAIKNRKKRLKAATDRRVAIETLSKFGFVTLGLLQHQSSHEGVWKRLDELTVSWKDILKIIRQCRGAAKLLKEDEFFGRIISWNGNNKGAVENILGNQYAARCFFATMHRRYVELGTPATTGDKGGSEFVYDMRRLFDDMLYLSITKWWVGQADIKLPNTIRGFSSNHHEKLVMQDRWEELITEMCDKGTINNTDYHKLKANLSADGTELKMSSGDYHGHIRSILKYHQILQGRNKSVVDISAIKEDDYRFDVDHIIPFDSWFKHLNPHKGDLIGKVRPMNYTHNITNLCLLGYDANRSKGSLTIDKWFSKYTSEKKYHKIIQEQLKLFADLPADVKQLEKMNSPEKYAVLHKERSEKIKQVFKSTNRVKHFFP